MLLHLPIESNKLNGVSTLSKYPLHVVRCGINQCTGETAREDDIVTIKNIMYFFCENGVLFHLCVILTPHRTGRYNYLIDILDFCRRTLHIGVACVK